MSSFALSTKLISVLREVRENRLVFWDCYGFNDTPTRSDFLDRAEIVGNIFENPELLIEK